MTEVKKKKKKSSMRRPAKVERQEGTLKSELLHSRKRVPWIIS
jgi:hypothetical protein